MARDVGNEIDEFVVPALRSNLLGLPLDLPRSTSPGPVTPAPVSERDARATLQRFRPH